MVLLHKRYPVLPLPQLLSVNNLLLVRDLVLKNLNQGLKQPRPIPHLTPIPLSTTYQFIYLPDSQLFFLKPCKY